MRSESKDWLRELKTGDVVAIYEWNMFNPFYKITNIEKITPTGFIKANGRLFSPESGKERGGYYCELKQATPELLQELRESNVIAECMKTMRNTRTVTYQQAVAIMEILKTNPPA
jgi:hypothetical protein